MIGPELGLGGEKELVLARLNASFTHPPLLKTTQHKVKLAQSGISRRGHPSLTRTVRWEMQVVT
jgi:hypothetical protein